MNCNFFSIHTYLVSFDLKDKISTYSHDSVPISKLSKEVYTKKTMDIKYVHTWSKNGVVLDIVKTDSCVD